MSIVKPILVIIRSFISNLALSLFRIIVTVKDEIIFISFPDYSDNALALSDYLSIPDVKNTHKIYWIVENANSYQKKFNQAGIIFLNKKNWLGMTPFKTVIHHLQAKFVFATHSFLIPQEKAKPEQKYILLWHGCGFKAKTGSHYTQFDTALVPGPLFLEPKSRYWKVLPEKLLSEGYPRYDWMLHPSQEAESYFKVLKKEYDKVIFWLPTVRNSKVDRDYPEKVISHFPILANTKDWQIIDKWLSSVNMLLVVKLHNSQKKYPIPFDEFTNIRVVDNNDLGKAGINLYELFPFTNALITDYSSVSFDYLVVDKPICYTLDDYKIYESTRGFVFDHPLDYMPGHHVYNMQELMTFLEDMKCDRDNYKQKRKEVRDVAVTKNDSSYCEQILKALEVI